MLLSCPHCSAIGEIPDIFRKFHGVPVSCHNCSGVFFIKKTSGDAATFFVKDKYHISACQGCASRLMIAGDRRHAHGLTVLCPVCAHDTVNGASSLLRKITLVVLLLLVILLAAIIAAPSSPQIAPLVSALRQLPAELLYHIDVLSLSLARYMP